MTRQQIGAMVAVYLILLGMLAGAIVMGAHTSCAHVRSAACAAQRH